MKKGLSLFLTLILLSLLCVCAFAEEDLPAFGEELMVEELLTGLSEESFWEDCMPSEDNEILPEPEDDPDALPADLSEFTLELAEQSAFEEPEDPDSCTVSPEVMIAAFVERCYQQILSRSADPAGLEFWKNALKNGDAAGADIVSLFCGSDEFKSRHLDSSEVVNILYRVMLDRAPDAGGIAYWTDMLSKGVSCNSIISGFAGSAEFAGICATYGIVPGTVALETRDLNPSVTAFVNRCYTVALSRNGDAEGLNGWTGNLLNNVMSAQQVSYAFLFSDEFISMNFNNDEYINRLYHLYMNREPDPAGRSGWITHLNNGMSRDRVAQGFANSDEFGSIVLGYGLNFIPEAIPDRGSPSEQEEPEEQAEPQQAGRTYVLNKNTGVFHYPTCASVRKMSPKNRWNYTGTRQAIIGMGYRPCQNCHP